MSALFRAGVANDIKNPNFKMLFISVEKVSEMLEDEMVKDEPVPEEGRSFV